MSEIVITNKNLVEALKQNTCLESVIFQYQQLAGTTGGNGENRRGSTSQKRRYTLLLFMRV